LRKSARSFSPALRGHPRLLDRDADHFQHRGARQASEHDTEPVDGAKEHWLVLG
jgi:hypothetical protein